MARPTIPHHAHIHVNGQECADALGIHRATLEKLAKEGVLPRVKPGVFDLKKVFPPFLAYRLQQAGVGNTTPQRDFNVSRADLYKVRAERERLALGQQRGDLLEASSVVIAVTNAISLARSRLLGIGAKIAPRLSLINSVAKIRGLIDAEITLALSELANARIVETKTADAARLGGDDEGGDEDLGTAAGLEHIAVGGRASATERRVER